MKHFDPRVCCKCQRPYTPHSARQYYCGPVCAAQGEKDRKNRWYQKNKERKRKARPQQELTF